MGDRCDMYVVCKTEDADKFVNYELGFEVHKDKGELSYLFCEQANYAHCGKMPEDVDYIGLHTEGDNYGPMHFLCLDDLYVECHVNNIGQRYVTVDKYGHLNEESHKSLLLFLKKLDKAKERLNLPEDWDIYELM